MSSHSHRLLAVSTAAALAATAAAIYLYFKFRKPKTVMNCDGLPKKNEIDIDSINRNVNKKRISYCRCWKSKTFPLCDGAHKYHNRDNDDNTGPLVMFWNDVPEEDKTPATTLTDLTVSESGGDSGAPGTSAFNTDVLNSPDDELARLDTSFISEMDVKSIDSDSPALEAPLMSHFDANGGSASSGSDSIEVIDDSEVKLINEEHNEDGDKKEGHGTS